MFRKLLCKMFGHTIKPFTYGKYWGGARDGIGREHGFYLFECKRCGKKVFLYVHFPSYFKFDRKEYNEKMRKKA